MQQTKQNFNIKDLLVKKKKGEAFSKFEIEQLVSNKNKIEDYQLSALFMACDFSQWATTEKNEFSSLGQNLKDFSWDSMSDLPLSRKPSQINFGQIIADKKEGKELSEQEIQFWVDGVTNKTIPDYQTAALLMAIYFQQMSVKERTFLTQAMAKSGDILDFTKFTAHKVDKHSTGGVGDKTSLMISPIISALGFYNPMISGRGLCHTGGTIDKLESIEGYQTSITEEKMRDCLEKTGCFIAGQTSNFAPADKVLYALRDVTQTVNDNSLITSSILSKKFAEGIDTLTLDIKCGSGAFMRNFVEAVELGESLVKTANGGDVKCNGVITRMDYPLGLWSGNACEIYESYESLKPDSDYTKIVQNRILFNEKMPGYITMGENNLPESHLDTLVYITFGLLLNMLMLTGKDAKTAFNEVRDTWVSGKALEIFESWIKIQGGDLEKLKQRFYGIKENFDKNTENVYIYRAKKDCKIEKLEGQQFGWLLVELGAGRKVQTDKLNHDASMQWFAYPGQTFKAGDVIAKFYHPDVEKLKEVDIEQWMDDAITFTDDLQFKDDVPFIHYILTNNCDKDEVLARYRKGDIKSF